jgi:hypothetical protein
MEKGAKTKIHKSTEGYRHPVFDAIYSDKKLPTIRRNILIPS